MKPGDKVELRGHACKWFKVGRHCEIIHCGTEYAYVLTDTNSKLLVHRLSILRVII